MMQFCKQKFKTYFLIAAAAFYAFYLIGYDVGQYARFLSLGMEGIPFLRYFINTALITFCSLAAPVSVLLSFCFAKKSGKWKNLLLPVGFGLKAITAFSLAFSSSRLLTAESLLGVIYYLLLLVQGISVVAMFIGTLNKGAFAPLLKWSALTHVAAAVLLEVAYLAYLLPRVGFGHFFLNSSTHSLSVILANLFYFALFLTIAPAKKANFK